MLHYDLKTYVFWVPYSILRTLDSNSSMSYTFSPNMCFRVSAFHLFVRVVTTIWNLPNVWLLKVNLPTLLALNEEGLRLAGLKPNEIAQLHQLVTHILELPAARALNIQQQQTQQQQQNLQTRTQQQTPGLAPISEARTSRASSALVGGRAASSYSFDFASHTQNFATPVSWFEFVTWYQHLHSVNVFECWNVVVHMFNANHRQLFSDLTSNRRKRANCASPKCWAVIVFMFIVVLTTLAVGAYVYFKSFPERSNSHPQHKRPDPPPHF